MNEDIIVRLLFLFYDIFFIFVTVFRNISISITNMIVLKRLYNYALSRHRVSTNNY